MLARKMFRQQLAGLLHPVDDARREFGLTEIAGHGVRQLAPECIPAFRMNARVPNDGKLVRARRHKYQHAIPLRRAVHVLAHEFMLGRGHRVLNVPVADADTDDAGGFLFGLTDGRHNILVMQMFGKFARVHGSPTSSGAPAAKAAAASRKASTTKSAAAESPSAKTAPKAASATPPAPA